MLFFLNMIPPTVTGQMRKVTTRGGAPRFYDPPKVKEARKTFLEHLSKFAPKEPMKGPIFLQVRWYFPKGKSHGDYDWKATRPDTDNLEKLFKDCMTKAGFWKDDAQVACEVIQKQWSGRPGIQVTVEQLDDDMETFVVFSKEEDEDVDFGGAAAGNVCGWLSGGGDCGTDG